MKKRIWIIIAVLLILIGSLIFVAAMNVLNWDFKRFNTEKHETNIYDITDEFNDISINTNTSDIIFVPSDNGVCQVVCFEQKNEKHSILVQENALKIDVNDTRKWYDHITFFGFDIPKITIYLPQEQYATLSVKSSTGDIKIPKDFTFDKIDIKASTGNVNCQASTANNLKIKLSTGDIKLENVNAGNVNLAVSTGKTYLTNIKCISLISESSTGDIVVKNVVAEKSLDITSDTGKVMLNKCDANEIFIETDTGDVWFDNVDAKKAKVQTDTGNVKGSLQTAPLFITHTDTGRVSVPRATNDSIFEIDTDTGDIIFEVEK